MKQWCIRSRYALSEFSSGNFGRFTLSTAQKRCRNLGGRGTFGQRNAMERFFRTLGEDEGVVQQRHPVDQDGETPVVHGHVHALVQPPQEASRAGTLPSPVILS